MAHPHDTVPTCIDGMHRPRRRTIALVAGVQRANCRDCGCQLVRTAVSRRWYRSGLMGGAATPAFGAARTTGQAIGAVPRLA